MIEGISYLNRKTGELIKVPVKVMFKGRFEHQNLYVFQHPEKFLYAKQRERYKVFTDLVEAAYKHGFERMDVLVRFM